MSQQQVGSTATVQVSSQSITVEMVLYERGDGHDFSAGVICDSLDLYRNGDFVRFKDVIAMGAERLEEYPGDAVRMTLTANEMERTESTDLRSIPIKGNL